MPTARSAISKTSSIPCPSSLHRHCTGPLTTPRFGACLCLWGRDGRKKASLHSVGLLDHPRQKNDNARGRDTSAPRFRLGGSALPASPLHSILPSPPVQLRSSPWLAVGEHDRRHHPRPPLRLRHLPRRGVVRPPPHVSSFLPLLSLALPHLSMEPGPCGR